MNALDARSPAGDFLPRRRHRADDVAAAVPRLVAGERLPRMLGEPAFPLLGERFARRVNPYTVWMTQRLPAFR